MPVTINGNKIDVICKICSLKYGKVKEVPQDELHQVKNALCDICENTGSVGIKQSVFPTSDFRGVDGDIFDEK